MSTMPMSNTSGTKCAKCDRPMTSSGNCSGCGKNQSDCACAPMAQMSKGK